MINVKADKDQVDTLPARDGIHPAYHMYKKCRVSIILDGTLTDEEIRRRIDESPERL